ncbi:hypothetical protein DE146DRAFT_334456 [Phaeosphaeria sp. MPI-PUGE-AT-0046c]|nr:hypothetical protein DE146DRAFT_334456 [Phaeosphaeria sp. MPI-PUGE-AT-0046c]
MHDRTRVSCGVSDVLAMLGPMRHRAGSVTLRCFALNSHPLAPQLPVLQYPLSCLAPRNPMIPVPWTSVVQGHKGLSGRPAETRRAYSATCACAAPLSLPATCPRRECRSSRDPLYLQRAGESGSTLRYAVYANHDSLSLQSRGGMPATCLRVLRPVHLAAARAKPTVRIQSCPAILVTLLHVQYTALCSSCRRRGDKVWLGHTTRFCVTMDGKATW